jgi:hypothetical protein
MVGTGRFGSTQGTMLSLKFLIEYFKEHGSKISEGHLDLTTGGELIDSVSLAEHKGYVIDYSEKL